MPHKLYFWIAGENFHNIWHLCLSSGRAFVDFITNLFIKKLTGEYLYKNLKKTSEIFSHSRCILFQLATICPTHITIYYSEMRMFTVFSLRPDGYNFLSLMDLKVFQTNRKLTSQQSASHHSLPPLFMSGNNKIFLGLSTTS